MVEEQELGETERFGTMQVRADRELAEPLYAQVTREVHPVPDRFLQLYGPACEDGGRNPQFLLAGMFGERQVVGACPVADDSGQVGVGQRVAQEQVRVELAGVL